MIKSKAPTALISLYNDVAIFNRIDEGRVVEEFIPTATDLQRMITVLNTMRKVEDKVFAEIYAQELISSSPYRVYYKEPLTYSFTVAQTKEKNFNVLLPAMILVELKQEILTFAVKARSRSQLSVDEKLYQYPLPNLYNDGRLCYGSAEKYNLGSLHSQEAYQVALQMLFGVAFTVHVHNRYLFNDLMAMYRSKAKPETILRKWDNMLKTSSEYSSLSNFIS